MGKVLVPLCETKRHIGGRTI
ncbi:hypothetical protein EMIT0P12_20457 [Pseudomonas sp. IT-P12]